MPKHYSSGNKPIWSSARRRILGLGLASLTITITSVIHPESVVAQDSNLLAKVSKKLPTVSSAALGTNMNVPWSQPVRIIDPFEGDYVGIFDRNYFYRRFLDTNARVEVVSLWSLNSIRFLLAYRDRDCLSGHSFNYIGSLGVDCSTFNAALSITNLLLKIGDRVFRLEGQNSTFAVSDELAAALKNSPTGNVSIRLVAESGEAVDSEIGEGTVKAWKDIY